MHPVFMRATPNKQYLKKPIDQLYKICRYRLQLRSSNLKKKIQPVK